MGFDILALSKQEPDHPRPPRASLLAACGGTGLARYRPMDAPTSEIRARLLQDHERLEQMFEKVIAAFEDDDRRTIEECWTRFDAELVAHMDAEERLLIPSLFRVNERAARSLIQEHRHIRGRLLELG